MSKETHEKHLPHTKRSSLLASRHPTTNTGHSEALLTSQVHLVSWCAAGFFFALIARDRCVFKGAPILFITF